MKGLVPSLRVSHPTVYLSIIMHLAGRTCGYGTSLRPHTYLTLDNAETSHDTYLPSPTCNSSIFTNLSTLFRDRLLRHAQDLD